MLPRQILPGTTYLVTRRCTQRQFLLKPTGTTTEIFAYCLAVAAARYRIQVHAVCVLSNHYHAVITDPDGTVPEFLRYLHEFVAKAVNASLGRWENLWASEPPSLVRLLDPADVLDKLRYLIGNPVAAGLVKRAKRWPGLLCYLPRHTRTVPRPRVLFRQTGPLPPHAELRLTVPPALPDLAPEVLERDVGALVRATEDRVAHEFGDGQRSFLGEAGVLAQAPTDRPRTPEPRRELSPRLAARHKWRRIETLQRLKAFVEAYRQAWRRWRVGGAGVVFPAGTYGLRVRAGVRCEAPAT